MEKLVCSTAEFSQTLEEMIADGACVPLCVSGTSMNPFLIDGRDVVRLRACTQDDLKKGRILLFRRDDGSLVLHRIKKVLPDGLLLMNGDAQTWCEKTDTSHVIALAYETEHDGKTESCVSYCAMAKNCVWQLLMPFRRWIMALWRKIKHISEKMKWNGPQKQ